MQNLKKKFLLDIHNLSHIHQLSLTYFGDFAAYFCSIISLLLKIKYFF